MRSVATTLQFYRATILQLCRHGPWEVEAFASQGRWLPMAITRVGQTTVPVPRQLVQEGERIHLAVQRSALEAARTFLSGLDGATIVAAAPPEGRRGGRR